MTISIDGRLVLIGAGKMGSAMLYGWLRAGVDPSRIVIIDPAPSMDLRSLVDENGIVVNPPLTSIADARVIVLAVKPQMFDAALSGLGSLLQPNSLVISIIAGKTAASIARQFGGDVAVVRAMPNTPASVGRGITALTANRHVGPDQLALAGELLRAVGEVVTVEREEQIDAVTAISGSGPAYVFYLTECLAEAGRKLGLADNLAVALASATISGSGELLRLSGLPAATLRKNVTSPGGTTQAALDILMGIDGLQPLLERAVAAAYKRSRELAG
jgi:pyrroline-5-carboxylate reductase